MKHLSPCLAFIAIASIFCSSSNAQQSSLQNSEVIIEVPGILYERGYSDIAGSLLLRDGIEVVGFCEKLHVLLIHVDRTKQPDDSEIIDALVSMKAPYYIKEGTSFSKVIENCDEGYYPISNPDNNSQSH